MLNIVNPNSNAMFNTRTKASSLSSEMKYSSSLKLISEFSQRDRVVQRVLFFFNFLFKFHFTLLNARVQNARKFPARCQCSSLTAAAMYTVSVYSSTKCNFLLFSSLLAPAHGSSESQCSSFCSTVSRWECFNPAWTTNVKKIAVKYCR